MVLKVFLTSSLTTLLFLRLADLNVLFPAVKSPLKIFSWLLFRTVLIVKELQNAPSYALKQIRQADPL